VLEEKLQFSDTLIENILHKPVLMPRQRNRPQASANL